MSAESGARASEASNASAEISWEDHIAACVRLACELEVLSPKPGNVFPGREFSNASVSDFLKSADVIATILAQATRRPLGETILQCVKATQMAVGHNTNLGIILLLAPLASVPQRMSLTDGIDAVLEATTIDDARLMYQAIREAAPNGLGEVPDQDLDAEPTCTLTECMRLAAAHDHIAAQYANGFRDVLECGQQWLRDSVAIATSARLRIAWLAVRMMSEWGDTLIARKCGQPMSNIVRERARMVLSSGWPQAAIRNGKDPLLEPEFGDFDAFLRADGHQRNPGTTADMVAAVLFANFRDDPEQLANWTAQNDGYG
jgi:triphosphoribosyl-dephospho-CoA synthase